MVDPTLPDGTLPEPGLPGLSVIARQRQQHMLPGLLDAVRRRRRARELRRAVLVLLLGGAIGVMSWPGTASRSPDGGTGPANVADAPTKAAVHWIEVHDDPTVVARISTSAAVRTEWFVDDAGLQELLVASGRPAGMVRFGNSVQIAAAAIDPWGSDAP